MTAARLYEPTHTPSPIRSTGGPDLLNLRVLPAASWPRFALAANGDHRPMDDKEREEVEADELESQGGEELPNREVMSIITPELVDGDVVISVEGDPGDRW